MGPRVMRERPESRARLRGRAPRGAEPAQPAPAAARAPGAAPGRGRNPLPAGLGDELHRQTGAFPGIEPSGITKQSAHALPNPGV